MINTVGPDSTTAQMAGEVPKETQDNTEAVPTPSDVPGGFPVTPATELDKPVSVNPLPAAEGAVNPIKLEPGEKVPEAIVAQNINEHVKLDKESYEKSDTIPGVQSNMTAPPTTDEPVIPESGIPITTAAEANINTVGPNATTVGLAGGVPLEAKVPEVVKESQDKAGADPEASAVAEEVREKAEVEDELKEKVPEAPSTSEGTSGVGTEKSENTSTIAATVATTGGAVAAAAIAAGNTIAEKATPAINQAATVATEAANQNLPDSVKQQLPESAQAVLATQNKEEKREEVSPEVPAEVKQSITEAGENPEAAANTSAVEEKKQVEAELLKEVKPAPAETEAKGSEVQPEVKTEQPQSEAPVTATPAQAEETQAAAPTNGSSSKDVEPTQDGSKPADASSTEKKKKNRLSVMLSKIKHKISDKN